MCSIRIPREPFTKTQSSGLQPCEQINQDFFLGADINFGVR